MSLIYIGPDGARYPLTPDQYSTLVAKLRSDPEVTGLDMVANSTAGGCTFQKITFSWTYNGKDELAVAILEDHNWKAHLAGNEAIFGVLDEKFIIPATMEQA